MDYDGEAFHPELEKCLKKNISQKNDEVEEGGRSAGANDVNSVKVERKES